MTSASLTWEVMKAPQVELGERPVWDPNTERLIWVDINAGQLHRFDPGGGDEIVISSGVPIGAAAPRAAGGYVLAAADGFRLTDASGAPAGPPTLPADMPEHARFNDGACDPAGRFWAGAKVPDGQSGTGALYRFDLDGSFTRMLGGVTESNGLGWSPDGTIFYYTDSGEEQSRVRAFGFDMASGTLGADRDLIRFGPADGVADGLVVDAAGCLWIAMWDGGCVRRYAPDGELIGSYPVPTVRPTCPGFGGTDLDELYVTTAWEGLGDQERMAEPLAGHLLRARPGVRGLAPACYGG